MAGHSRLENVVPAAKGRQDAARSKLFAKLAREITVAVKYGSGRPGHERAAAACHTGGAGREHAEGQHRAGDQEGGRWRHRQLLESIRYEGYGPGGVAVIVEALSDNRNRTGGAIRAVFTKHGGNLGATGAVAHMFAHVGEITYPATAGSADAVLEAAIEAGADDVQSDASGHVDRVCVRRPGQRIGRAAD